MILLASSGVMEASIGSDGPSLMVVVKQFHSIQENRLEMPREFRKGAYLTIT